MSLKPVLAAEDDENDVIILQRLFSRCRIKNPLIVVSDGEDVIAYLKREGKYADREQYPLPAMLLLDMRMRRKGGFEVLDWFGTKAKPKFPVVILTGFTDLSRMKEAYLKGAHCFLLKPVAQTDFLSFMAQFHEIEIESQSTASAA
ncbi:MAG TPA: response regulator [Candidatus Binatia bacterium]|jgi:FixJ family two-component response regulator|nr:response regulator [Candidatus Binatia bacterium]